MHGSIFGSAFGGMNQPSCQPLGNCEASLTCTLQEFFNGCKKTVSYERQIVGLDGRTTKVETCSKSVIVSPGMSEKTVMIMRGDGNQ